MLGVRECFGFNSRSNTNCIIKKKHFEKASFPLSGCMGEKISCNTGLLDNIPGYIYWQLHRCLLLIKTSLSATLNQASESWLAPDNLNQLCKAHVVKLLRIFLPKTFCQNKPPAHQADPTAGKHLEWQATGQTLAERFELWPLASHCDSGVTYRCHKRWYFPLGQRQPKHNVTQPCPQTVHQNGVLHFKWTDSCGPLLSEHETADTCWVVKVSRPDWRAIVLVSSGSSQPLSPVMFIISISIFKGVDAGQRWQPF